jgi:cytochrome P450
VDTTYSHTAHLADFEPTESYRALREQCPIHHETQHDPPFYVLTRFDDIVAALKHPRQFLNRDGPGVFYQNDGVLGTTDDPDHSRQRHVLRTAFLPSAIARLEPRIAAIADAFFDEIVPTGECEFIGDYAFAFPAVVIAELLGVRAEDRDNFRRWTADAANALTGGDLEVYAASKERLAEHIDAGLAERDAMLAGVDLEPGVDPIGTVLPADVLSMMAIGRRDGVITATEARLMGYQLLVAGHETTTSLLGMMLYRLIEHPDVVARLRAEPELLPRAIEEALRFDSPVNGLFRTNTEQCVLHDTTIPERSKIQMLYASANRDPEQFHDPDEFLIDREPRELNRHLAFGWGIHYCIGAPLARMETRVTFERILQRMGDIELAGPAVRNESFILHGLTSLPIRWTPLS